MFENSSGFDQTLNSDEATLKTAAKERSNHSEFPEHPQSSDENWMKIGYIKNLYIEPLKSGQQMLVQSLRYNQHGLIWKSEGAMNVDIWDGMFLVYNQQTKAIANISDYWNMIEIEVLRLGRHNLGFHTKNMEALYVDCSKLSVNAREVVYCSSWYDSKPVKLFDCGANAASWINRYLGTSNLRLLQRSCNPLDEESNVIRENWIQYERVLSTKAEEKKEEFANLPRCVLMTTPTLQKLHLESKHGCGALLFRPNILVSVPYSIPFTEEDWEWIRIGDTIIKRIKTVPKYNLERSSLVPLSNDDYTNDKEDDTAHLGVYCATFVPGDISVNDNVYVYKTKKWKYFCYNFC